MIPTEPEEETMCNVAKKWKEESRVISFLRRVDWGFVAPVFIWLILGTIIVALMGCDKVSEARSVETLKIKTDMDALDHARRSIEFEHYITLGSLTTSRQLTADMLRLGKTIEYYADAHGLDARLIAAIIRVESEGRPHATSRKGARGLMQVMPHMARAHGITCNLYRVECNIAAGTTILAANIDRWGYVEGIERYLAGSGKLRGGMRFYRKVMAAKS